MFAMFTPICTRRRTTRTRLSLRSLILPALFVVCAQAQAQNTVATGEPAVTAADSADLTMVGPNEDIVLTAARGTIMDDTDDITTFSPTWAWQQADAPNTGTPADSDYSAIAGATAATFTPLQEHGGKFIRACATFDDDAGNSETRCWTSAAAVVNVNDKPVALDNTIFVPVGGSYTFSADDFPFTDEERDTLRWVTVNTVPSRGTVAILGSGASRSFDVSKSHLDSNNLTYVPSADATAPMAGYTTFTFVVRAGGGNREHASAAATMTIDLVQATQSAATGTLIVTAASGAAYNEGAELTASTAGIIEPNGIRPHGLMWQWQSASAPISGAPPASAYGDITSFTDATFTPSQAYVGTYIRVCLNFTDGLGTAEGPFCSAGARVFDALRLRLRLFLEGPLR